MIGYLLWSRKHTNRFSNRLLALILYVYAYTNFVISLIVNGSIVELPHFFRTAAPLNYLIGPLIYLYVRSSLFSTNRFDYRYGWLFLPALLNFAELTPFYAQSAAYKIARLQELAATSDSVINLSEGWFPPSLHLIVCTLLNMGYSVLTWRMLWMYKKHKSEHYHINAIYAHWLKIFVLINVLTNLFVIIGMPFVLGTPYANYGFIVTIIVSESIICFYVIQRPALLYGAYWLEKDIPIELKADKPNLLDEIWEEQPNAVNSPIPSEPADAIVSTKKLGLEDEPDIHIKLELLEQYMITQQPYLQPRLSLANVSVATNIPPYLLSAMLNQVQGLDFRDYVNAHRVRYVCDLVNSNRYNHLALEGISQEAGFSSKTTFYRAFQKHTGLPPSRYFNLNKQTAS